MLEKKEEEKKTKFHQILCEYIYVVVLGGYFLCFTIDFMHFMQVILN